MRNRSINLQVVAEVARALKELREDVVFVGGAIVSVYIDDPAADEVRPTADIDLTIDALGLSDWVNIQERLAELGFHPDPFGSSICSYKYKDIPVDFMPMTSGHLGPANRWYSACLNSVEEMNVHGIGVKIFSAPAFIATKLEAFFDRGQDWRTSHDVEDVIYLIDNRSTIVEEVHQSDPQVKMFIQTSFRELKNRGLLSETLQAHIHPLMLADRLPMVEDKIEKIISI